MNHIVVIGFMGSGKTRVGKRLAQDLNLPFIDLDKAIVKKMNMSIAELLDKFGDPYYRALETVLIKELAQDKEKKVISVSSALPAQKQNAPHGTVACGYGSQPAGDVQPWSVRNWRHGLTLPCRLWQSA